jgi:O-antigen ligase
VITAQSATPGRAPAAAIAAILGALALLSVTVTTGRGTTTALILTVGVVVVSCLSRWVFSWPTLIGAVVLVLLFVPIRRYALPGSLPFELEPYRVVIAAVAVCWVASLLVDRSVHLRRTFMDGPMIATFFAAAVSIAANMQHIIERGVSDTSIKALTFLASFVLVFYIVVSLTTTMKQVHALLELLVAAAGVVALVGIVQRITGFNPFDHLERVIPFLVQTGSDLTSIRSGSYRASSSAQHPIALGAMLVMLLPPALYLYSKTRQRRWLLIGLVLLLGALASASRTAVTMLLACVVVYLVLRPRQTTRLWPALIPILAAVHFVVPGILGTFYHGFFPEQGLIAEQADASVGSSRVASLGPGLHVVGLHPLLGVGYGSRISTSEDAVPPAGVNSFIVDDQWLATAMETGIFGFLVWVWFFAVFIRRMGRSARRERGDYGWLYTALTASSFSFAVGMLTFDAFSFIQATFVLFLLIAVGCIATNIRQASERLGVTTS